MSDREPFYLSKAAGGFADLTRWGKDTFGTVRGILALALIGFSIFGVYKLVKIIRPAKEVAPVSVGQNSGSVETGADKKFQIGFINR